MQLLFFLLPPGLRLCHLVHRTIARPTVELILPWSTFSRGGPVQDPVLTPAAAPHHSHLTQSVFKVVLQKSVPTQIRQLVLDISHSKG